MKQDFCVVIPARYASTRLPGKPLLRIDGKPMLQYVFEAAGKSGAAAVVVATDDERIAEAARGFGADVCMTGAQHLSGTDRCAEVAALREWSEDTLLVNVQGDEPLMPPAAIRQVAENLVTFPQADITTLATALHDASDMANPNVVKVVRAAQNFALYFSRASIPYARDVGAGDLSLGARHLGIYGYRVAALRKMTAAPAANIELAESLEQLRAMYLGLRIHCADAVEVPGPGVDTHDDLQRVQALLLAG